MKFVRYLVLALPMILSHSEAFAKVEVVTSFSILQNLTEEVGGSDVNVHSLVPLGTDPHGFNPRPADILRVKGAQLVVLTGWGLEPWAHQIWKASNSRARQLIVTDGLQPLKSEPQGHSHDHADPHDHDHGPQDPHFWHDPARVRKVVTLIAQNLAEIDPSHKDGYTTRAEVLNAKIEAIEISTRNRLRALELSKPTLLSSHDGFQYFGEAFGVRFTSVIGVSTADDVRAGRLAKARELIRKNQIRGAVFEEGHADQALRTAIAKAEIPTVTMAADGLSTRVPTYLEFLKNNTDRLVEVLSQGRKVTR